MKLKEISISITDTCNSRCAMCEIWKAQNAGDFDSDLLARLPRDIVNVVLSGGEPFMRRDIPQVVRRTRITCPRARIAINTNGLLTELITNDAREILAIDPRIAIRVSLDGIGDLHDRIRGCPHAYERALETLRSLKRIGVRDLGVILTLTNANVRELPRVFELAKMEKVKFICQVAHSSEFYFRKENEEIADKTLLRAQLEQIMRSELRSSDPYGWFKAYFYRGLWDHVNHVPRGDGCGAGSLFCYLDSSGDMYPCILLKEKMGTVKEAALADVWMSRAADEVREKVKGCDRNCWLICTATPSIKERPQRALPWILKNMIRAHTAHALL